MCRPPFCYFCGEAKVGPRGSDSPDCSGILLFRFFSGQKIQRKAGNSSKKIFQKPLANKKNIPIFALGFTKPQAQISIKILKT